MLLNTTKQLLLIKSNDHSQDELLSTVNDLTLAKVKALCNIPKDDEILQDYDFELLMAQISADVFNCYEPKTKKATDSTGTATPTMPTGEIKSMTIGDYTVQYNTATTSYSTHSLSESISYNLDKYDEELAHYRFFNYL